MTDPVNDPRAPRSNIGLLALAAPIVAVTLLVIGYGSALVATLRGNPADGPRLRVVYQGCAEARPLIEERVATVGLGDPQWEALLDGFALTATFPSNEAELLPDLLARTGAIELRRGGRPEVIVTPDQVSEGLLSLDLTMNPSLGLVLNEAGAAALKAATEGDLGGSFDVVLDGVVIGTKPNAPPITDGLVSLMPPPDRLKEAVQVTAHQALIVDHGPLPCPVARVP